MNTQVMNAVRPGLRHGTRPVRRSTLERNRVDTALAAFVTSRQRDCGSFKAFGGTLASIRRKADAYGKADPRVRERARSALIAACHAQPVSDARAIRIFAFAIVDIVDVLGFELHDEQLYAAWAMLHGTFVEMRTGEGKTVSAALPCIAIGLSGMPVHVVTANDYLAWRDEASLRALYERFSLTTGVLEDSLDDSARGHVYAADVVYGAARQFVFDHLRDAVEAGETSGAVTGQLDSLLGEQEVKYRQRGLCAAIVDEADSVLLDEARTPFVLSETVACDSVERARHVLALAIARNLHDGVDFRCAYERRTVELSQSGHEAVEAQTSRLQGVWRRERYRDEIVSNALIALHIYRRDHDYLLCDGQIVLIDRSSGRPQPQVRLQHGLHRLLELKEGCDVTSEAEFLASLSLQTFFRRYHHLAGMSGTLDEVSGELRTIYGVPTRTVPTHRDVAFERLGTTVEADRDAQMMALLSRLETLKASGRPVLIGTRSLALSESISAGLSAAGVEHRLLNARQDADEAEIIRFAGQDGSVTLATNMAGRGADIPLSTGARDAGGLHVINVELNDSTRIDRQLFGRASRQGDPGSGEALYSLDDETLQQVMPASLIHFVATCLNRGSACAGQTLARLMFARARRSIERRHAHQRLALFHETELLLRQLAIAGE